MDLNALTIAQHRPENQLRFDAEAFDRAILRAERRRTALRTLGSGLVRTSGAMADALASIIKMALGHRPA